MNELTLEQPKVISPERKKLNKNLVMAHELSQSTIIPKNYQGRPKDTFATITTGEELGMGPMQSLNGIVIIQGQMTLKAQTILALIRQRCPDAIVEVKNDFEKMSVSVFMKRNDRDPGYIAIWNMETAKQMKLSHKENYQTQPMTMLRWRAISEAGRIVFPDITNGLYATEEIQDLTLVTDKESAIEMTRAFI